MGPVGKEMDEMILGETRGGEGRTEGLGGSTPLSGVNTPRVDRWTVRLSRRRTWFRRRSWGAFGDVGQVKVGVPGAVGPRDWTCWTLVVPGRGGRGPDSSCRDVPTSPV